MRILITGITGFTGKNFINFLKKSIEQDIHICGISRDTNEFQGDSLIQNISMDLLDQEAIKELIKEFSPEIIFHFAGVNKGTFQTLTETNVIGTHNLLNAVIKANINPRIIITGSSSQYGFAGNKPITEEALFMPLSEYGVSKCSQELLGRYLQKKFQMQIVFTRTFNLIGPEQSQTLFIGSIIHQLIEYKKGIRKEIEVIHLNSSRDYVDIRDAVRAYWMLASTADNVDSIIGHSFNVGSGVSTDLKQIVVLIFNYFGISPPLNLTNSKQMDLIPTQLSSIDLINNTIGWKPEYSFQESIRNILKCSVLDRT